MFPKNFAFCLWSPSFFFDCSLSLPLSLSDLLRASSSTDKIGPRQRPRRAAKLRVGKEKERVEGGRIQARRLGRVYKYVLLLARCRGGSPDLPVNFVIPFATSPTPFTNPRPCLSAPTLLEITEAHRWCASQQAMLGGRCFSFANEGMAKSGSCQRTQGDWIWCV